MADSTDSENDDSPAFDGRMEKFEEYRNTIETVRILQMQCLTHDVGVTDSGFARFKDAADDSPLAEDGLFYYRRKQELKAELREMRESGELEDDQNLPNYKEAFPEPEGDFTEISAENAEEFGIESEHFGEGETIQVPDAYESPTDGSGNLMVWNNAGTAQKQEVLESLNSVQGVGSKTAGRVLNQLQADGILPDDL